MNKCEWKLWNDTVHLGCFYSGSAQPGRRGPSPSRPFGPRVKQGIPSPLACGGSPIDPYSCRWGGAPIWGMGRREVHRWWRATAARLGRRWTPVRESPSGLGGRLGSLGGAPHRRGSSGDVSRAGGRPVEVGTGEVTTVEEEVRWHSASRRLHGSHRLSTKGHAK
jgi:hypothetical protein